MLIVSCHDIALYWLFEQAQYVLIHLSQTFHIYFRCLGQGSCSVYLDAVTVQIAVTQLKYEEEVPKVKGNKQDTSHK